MNRTVVIRGGAAEQMRRELKNDLVAMEGGDRVRHRREIWFASLAQLASVLTERRLELLRLVHWRRPRSLVRLVRIAGRTPLAVRNDLRVLEHAGLVELVPVGAGQRPVARYDRIHLAGDIAIARAAA